MDKERYNLLLKDSEIPKGGDFTSFLLKSESEKLIIHILFKHSGNPKNLDFFGKRIYLFVYPIENYFFKDEVKYYKKVKNESLVLANAHEYVFALTYKLKIDENNHKVSLKIEDMPEMNSIVTDEEKNGIEESY